MLLKSSRSTRWPYLFRSTVFGGVAPGTLDRTTWKSEDSGLFVTGANGAPKFDTLVLVDVRDKGAGVWNCWVGEGVSKVREGIALFQGAAQDGALDAFAVLGVVNVIGAIFVARKTSGNWVIR